MLKNNYFCLVYKGSPFIFWLLFLLLYDGRIARGFWEQETHRELPKILVYAEFESSVVKAGDSVELKIYGRVQPGWHIYSVKHQGEFGPKATQIRYAQSAFKPITSIQESRPKLIKDEALNMELYVHKNDFTFKQVLKTSSEIPKGEQELRGEIYYQICDNRICNPLQRITFKALLTINE